MNLSDVGFATVKLTFRQKILSLNWGLILLICLIASLGIVILYSLSDGIAQKLVNKQLIRFSIGFAIMIFIALVDIRIWMKLSYLVYFISLLLLFGVEIAGISGMGATRWFDLGVVTLQPSEPMKIALVMALARYFHEHTLEETQSLRFLIPPVILILLPVALVLRQPDLGTASLIILGGTSLLVLSGVRARVFIALIVTTISAIPFIWQYLHQYQRERILTFLDPERDPMGAGYHILQSKIALGAGGLFGRGYGEGTQSHLNFLPEMQTDFIFTTIAEDFGFIGALILLLLYLLILTYGLIISILSRNHFGRLISMGVSMTFFFYVFINVAMVTGLVPVVGVPLPLISYGGTAMVTLMSGFGLMMSVYIHRDIRIPRLPGGTLR